MTLKEFFEEVGGKESDIVEYSGSEALKAVKQAGYALQFVNEQTVEICIEAVQKNGYALRFVNKSIFDKQ